MDFTQNSLDRLFIKDDPKATSTKYKCLKNKSCMEEPTYQEKNTIVTSYL